MNTPAALMTILLVACADPSARLQPRVQVPAVSSDAYPYAAIDTLELSIARSGSSEALALVSTGIDGDLQLDGVPFGDDLVVHLRGLAGGTEVAYGRTCTVDIDASTPTIEPFLYFSRLVRWGAGPDLVVPRGRGVRALGLGPLVLLVGGGGGPAVSLLDTAGIAAVEPAAIFEGKLAEREGGTLEAFGNGALLLGGVDPEGSLLATIEFIQPREENVDNQILTLDGPALHGHASVRLEDGTILVSGGLDGAGTTSDAAFRYSLLAGEIVGRQLSPGLSSPRRGHSMTRLGNEVGADVLIAGGVDQVGQAVAQTELFRPLRSAFESVDQALMQTPRYLHRAVRLPGGFVLVIGGFAPAADGVPVPVRELELYDPVQGVFATAGTLPSGAGLIGMSVTELPDGRFMLAGGQDVDGEPVSTVLIARFDPIDGVVDLSPSDPLNVARVDHSAVLLCDGTVLVAGGTDVPSTETERYSPPSAGRR